MLASVMSYGQQIEIGQDAETVRRIIESNVSFANRPRSGAARNTIHSHNTEYYNGRIVTVRHCVRNQFFVNLRMNIHFCTTYLMTDGRLAYTITQYENVSLERLIEEKTAMWPANRIINNTYFFDEEFEYVEVFYLAERNGLATVAWEKVESSILLSLSEDVRTEITNRRRIQEIERAERTVRREEEARNRETRRLEIASKMYDLETYDGSAYNVFIGRIAAQISNDIRMTSAISYNAVAGIRRLDLNHRGLWRDIPTFRELTESKQKKYRYTNSFNIVGQSGLNPTIINTSSTDKNASIFGFISIRVPTIKIEGYDAQTEVSVDNFNIDIAKGVTTVRIRNGNIEFTRNIPDADVADKIRRQLSETSNGRYVIYYQYSNIMGEEDLFFSSSDVSLYFY